MTPTPPSPFAGPSSVLGTAQTRLARSRPLGSLVGRLLLGLTLLTGGSAAAWFSVSSGLRDGLHATDTVQTVPRAQAQALQAELTTDRGELAVTALPASATTQGLAAELRAHHRQFNPLHVTAAPAQGGEGAKAHTLSLHSQLLVDPPASPGVLSFQPPGVAVEHRLAARLAPGLPLSLSARAGSGDLELDLRRLKLRSLTTVSRSGDQTVQLPAQNLGRVRLSTTSGDVELTSAAGTVTPALSASSTFGNLHVRLSGAQVGRLDLRSRGGRVEADLPRQLNAALSTEGGELDLRVPGGAAGDLRVQTRHGSVALSLPANAAFRLSFPGLSTGQARALAAGLPGNLRYSDGAYLSRAAQDAGPRTPLLDIELDLPAAPELTLQLRTAPGTPPAADTAADAGADTATDTNTPEGELRP